MRVAITKDRLKFVIEAGLFLSAFVLFVLQIKDVTEKYFDGRTTISMRQEVPETLELPAFVFYLGDGFIAEKRLELIKRGGLSFARQAWNDTNVRHPYYEATYQLGRDFNITESFTELKVGPNRVNANIFRTRKIDVNVELLASHTDGLFYIIQYTNLEGKIHKPTFTLNLQNSSTGVQVFIMDPAKKYRAISNHHWKGVSRYIFEPQIGSSIAISLSKSLHKSLSYKGTKEKCQIYQKGESEDTCYWQKRAQKSLDYMFQNCTKVCATPPYASTLSLAHQEPLNLCASKEEVDCLIKAYWYNDPIHCLKSCINSQYHGSSRRLNDDRKNSSRFEVEYDFASMDVYEELLLFDFSSFIGNVGGSLGLFIGFSYFQFAKMMAFSIVDRMMQIK